MLSQRRPHTYNEKLAISLFSHLRGYTDLMKARLNAIARTAKRRRSVSRFTSNHLN